MRAVARAAVVMLAACSALPPSLSPPSPSPAPPAVEPFAAEPWPAGDAMFTRDPHWLGGDAVYSVDLHDGRILWLFGDSFVAADGHADRRKSTMVRNTVALQRGAAPARAELTFHWREQDGAPAAFFHDDGVRGYWPLHGVRIPNGPLLLFQTIVRSTPNEGLGFTIDGWRLLRCDDVRGEPAAWQWRTVVCAPLAAGVAAGTAVWLDSEHVVVLGTHLDGVHRGVLCRFAIADLDGDRVALQWWNGSAWSADSPPECTDVLDDAGPECSLHAAHEGDGERWLHVWSRGFGATTVALQEAPAATGPWTPPRHVFTPPECARERPFVYAAKAHPELDAGDGWLAVSYATNSFQFADLLTPAGQAGLYWPRFWRIRVR